MGNRSNTTAHVTQLQSGTERDDNEIRVEREREAAADSRFGWKRKKWNTFPKKNWKLKISLVLFLGRYLSIKGVSLIQKEHCFQCPSADPPGFLSPKSLSLFLLWSNNKKFFAGFCLRKQGFSSCFHKEEEWRIQREDRISTVKREEGRRIGTQLEWTFKRRWIAMFVETEQQSPLSIKNHLNSRPVEKMKCCV